MRVLSFLTLSLAMFVGVILPSSAAQAQKEPPYWASIDEPEARLRTGPSTEYPTLWIYKRQHLPVKIIARHKDWRKIEDHEGTQGWMHARLLSDKRTAIVNAATALPVRLYAQPSNQARLTWRAENGVVGNLSACGKGWCLLNVNGRQGYIQADDIWGDEAIK